jgi:large subunit ribosomal protein L30
MALKLKVTQIRSGVGKPETHRKVLAGLGLGRMHKSRVLVDNLAIRGMIRKVSHLVKVEPVE